MSGEAYNPLDKLNLARSIEAELLAKNCDPLAFADQIKGAGVYAIYYTGDFPAYRPVAAANRNDAFRQPIYVGKAIPTRAHERAVLPRTLPHVEPLAIASRVSANMAASANAANRCNFQHRETLLHSFAVSG